MDSIVRGYKTWLTLERGLSAHTVSAYLEDISKFMTYMKLQNRAIEWSQVSGEDLSKFLVYLHDLGLSSLSQTRIISGLRSFFSYLQTERIVTSDPSMLIEMPKTGRKLPEVLSVEEIDKMIACIDLSRPEGHRNKAIIETLYGCGLRVSELVALRISNIYMNDGFLQVIGKGNKERIVPMSEHTWLSISQYLMQRQSVYTVKKGYEDLLYLNRRGGKLSRQMIFMMIRQYASLAGISKTIGPHTFRHSFATHLIDGGADLRAIQEMLGHASISTTEIYTHLDRHFLRDTIIQYHPRS